MPTSEQITDKMVEAAYQAATLAMPPEALVEIGVGELDQVVRAALEAALSVGVDDVDNFINFILSDDSPVGPEDEADIQRFNNAVEEAKSRLAAHSDPQPSTHGLYGPYGWLNGHRGLSEDSWEVESDPLENSDEYFAIPLYALTDPLKEIGKEAALPKDGAMSEPPRIAGREIYEVANQLAGYVDEGTPERLAAFLLREAEAATVLADEIVRLRAAKDGAVGVKIKPLEWQHCPKGDEVYESWQASSVFGGYHVIDYESHISWAGPFKKERDLYSVERAKAAAQADFEARIRSAVASPSPAQEAGAEPVQTPFDAYLAFQRIRDALANGDVDAAFNTADEAMHLPAPPLDRGGEWDDATTKRLSHGHPFYGNLDDVRDFLNRLDALRAASTPEDKG